MTTADTATPKPTRPDSFSRRIPFMLRTVGLKAIHDQRTSLFWWASATALMSAIVIMLFPYIEGGEEIEALLEQLPPAFQAMLGEDIELSTAPGYLDLRMFTAIAPVIFLLYGIGRGNGAIAGEENRGTMDLLLSHPVRRWRVIVENAAAMLFGLTVIGIALWGGLVIGGLIVDVEFSFTRAAAATLMGVLLGLAFGSLALALGGWSGRSGMAIGISVAVAVAGYFLHSLAPLVDWLEPYRILSPFYYYIGHSAMLDGFKPGNALVLAVLSLVLVAVAAIAFQRRDVQI